MGKVNPPARSETSEAILELAKAITEAATPANGWDFENILCEWAMEKGEECGPAVNLHAYRNAVLTIRKALGNVVLGLKEGIAEYEAMAEMDAEACPGCGCLPGDGLTDGCNHPNGCGELRLQEATPHDLTMAGL